MKNNWNLKTIWKDNPTTKIIGSLALSGAIIYGIYRSGRKYYAHKKLKEGNKYYESFDFEKALDCFKQAQELDGSYADAYYSEVVALHTLGRYSDAIEKRKDALEISKDYDASLKRTITLSDAYNFTHLKLQQFEYIFNPEGLKSSQFLKNEVTFKNILSQFPRAIEYIDGSRSSMFINSNPALKSSDAKTEYGLLVAILMRSRPQYFEDTADNDREYGVILKLLQEFIKEGAIDLWENALIKKISVLDGANGELVNGTRNFFTFFKRIVENPNIDPFELYLDQADAKEQLVDSDEFPQMQSRLSALSEIGNKILYYLKMMDSSLNNCNSLTDVLSYQEAEYDSQKQADFEQYMEDILSNPGKNFLSSFWEHVYKNQLGRIFYDIVCESFEGNNFNSETHRIAKTMWAISQIDTINAEPKTARSRMPDKYMDGLLVSNFGYDMKKSQEYENWIQKNPLAKVCGDIIVDAYNAAVELGQSINIDGFLGLLRNDLQSAYKTPQEHYQHAFLRKFKFFLLSKIYNTHYTYSKEVSIEKALVQAANDDINSIVEQANNVLNDLRKCCANTSFFVLGIGFNGSLFGAPYHSYEQKNQIFIAFSDSRRAQGDLLLALVKWFAKGQLDAIVCNDMEDVDCLSDLFGKCKLLIKYYLENSLADYKTFLSQLKSDVSYNELSPDFKDWLKNTKNWYKVPTFIDIGVADEMPIAEHPAQKFARELLFNILTKCFNIQEYPKLMKLLFLHWKQDIGFKDLTAEAQEAIQGRIYNVNADLRETWQSKIKDKFTSFVTQSYGKTLGAIKQLEKTLNSHDKKLQKVSEEKNQKAINGLEQAKVKATKELEELKRKLPEDPSQLSSEQYDQFKKSFFQNVSQCIEPSFARVLGHNKFLSVAIGKADYPILDVKLGNKTIREIINPCDSKCQYHVLGHVYTGDMLSHQSIDRFDQINQGYGFRESYSVLPTYNELIGLARKYSDSQDDIIMGSVLTEIFSD